MSHLCLIALVSVLFAGFAEVHGNTHTVQIEVEGHEEHLSINVPANKNVSVLVGLVKKEVSKKLHLREADITAINEKTVKNGKEELGNILGKKNGNKPAKNINKVFVKVNGAKAKAGKKAHEVHDQNDEPEAGAGEAGGDAPGHPGKHPLAGLSGEDEKGGDAEENVDSGAAGI
ncbi:hypothetical protein Ddc_11228 [Ditylenchus destructor]|nr:hypothetical protein Ddc_11228 [Ditylenchus destructor]